MEKNENLQDKSEIESESTDKENQENLHQHASKNLNEDEGEKKEILPEDKINDLEDKNKEPGTVVQEIQKGFMMKGRLLRPSLVAVSKKPSENDKKTENSKKDEENQSKNEEKI